MRAIKNTFPFVFLVCVPSSQSERSTKIFVQKTEKKKKKKRDNQTELMMGPHFTDMYDDLSSDEEEPKRSPDQRQEEDESDEDSEQPSSRLVELLGPNDDFFEPIEGADEEGREESKSRAVPRPVGFMGTGKVLLQDFKPTPMEVYQTQRSSPVAKRL